MGRGRSRGKIPKGGARKGASSGSGSGSGKRNDAKVEEEREEASPRLWGLPRPALTR